MALIETLEEKAGLTETEEKIVEVILAEKGLFSEITIAELASKAYTSPAAVTRFAKKLGFNGWKDFRVSLIKDIQNEWHYVADVNPNVPFEYTDDAQTVSKKIGELSILAIQKTMANLDHHTLKEIAKGIVKSKRLFLFSTGDSQVRAISFQNKLFKINQYPILADAYSEADSNSLNVTKDDLVLFITYGATYDHLKDYLSYFKKEKVTTVVITGKPKRIEKELPTYMISLPEGEVDKIKIGTFFSQIILEYVLDVLYAYVYQMNYHENGQMLKKKGQILENDK